MAGDDEDDKLEAEQEVGTQRRLNDAPPIGMKPDGTINFVEKDAPRFDPQLAVEDDDDDDLSDLEDLEEIAKL